MATSLSCLIVSSEEFPEKKLWEGLFPEINISEFDYANNLSNAFQFLLNSNFNLCLINSKFDSEAESFFRDMQKLGRDKTCTFVRFKNLEINNKSTPSKSTIENPAFCTTITSELTEDDVKSLRNALSKEILRLTEEQKIFDIPKYVELVLKEVDDNARRIQRGRKSSYDKVIASLVRDMMSETSIHRDSFIDKLSEESEHSLYFETNSVNVPENVLERNLPKLNKRKYLGASSRVWNKLLKRYGDKEPSSE